MSNILEALEQFAQEVPGLLSCALVHRQDGTNIGSINLGASFDGEAADAYLTQMLQKHLLAVGAMGLADQTEDILISTESAFFLTRVLADTDYFLNVITSRQGNLGLTRALMRKHQSALVESLP